MAELSGHGTELYRVWREVESVDVENEDGSPAREIRERVLMSDGVALQRINEGDWAIICQIDIEDTDEWLRQHSKIGFVEV